MRVHEIVGRELRLDVRQRDEATETQQQAFSHERSVDLAVHHREVVAVDQVVVEQLIARETIGGGVAVVLAVHRGKSEAPVDVILLHRIGQPLDVDDGLIELHGIRRIHVGGRPVAARLHGVGADVAAEIDPPVDLDVGLVQRLAGGGVGHRRHQRAVHGIGPRHANGGRTAIRPLRERIGRGGLRRRRPVLAASRRCRRVGRRFSMAHLKRVVIDETGPEIIADAAVPIFWIGRYISPAVRRRVLRRRCP